MVVACMVLVVVGCGKKADCKRYAAHLTELAAGGRTGSHVASVESVALDSCEAGRVSADEANCVIAAKTDAESLRCQGLDKMAAQVENELPRVRVAGFSMGIPTGWTREAETNDPIVMLTSDNKHVAIVARSAATMLHADPLVSDAACRASRETSADGMTIDSAKLVDTRLGKSCRTSMHSAEIRIDTDLLAANRGDLITIGCTFPTAEAKPPAACQAMFDSVAIE